MMHMGSQPPHAKNRPMPHLQECLLSLLELVGRLKLTRLLPAASHRMGWFYHWIYLALKPHATLPQG